MTDPSYAAPVEAPIDARGTENPTARSPALPTSAVASAVLSAVASNVVVPLTPVTDASDVPPAVTWALPEIPATEMEPASAPPRLMLPAIVWASAS